jgi:hypothetical protein
LLGELVVDNGRLAGVRQALTARTILIGRAEQCDVRLNVADVDPLHCLVVQTPEGPYLRDLGSSTGTCVNGAVVTEHVLRSGDHLSIGPFQFTFELPASAEPPVSQAQLDAERDALRIQAAAVVAQQAALAEEEARLRQQRASLRKEKEQVAAHLDERRRNLLDMQEQVRQDRTALQVECEAARKEHQQQRTSLEQEREALSQRRKQAERERLRCIELRKRLKRRWRRHWGVQEQAQAAREKMLASGWEKLHQETDALQRDRAALVQAQLRFNGEAELGRRQLQDEWQQLGLAQQQWEVVLNQEQAERRQHRQALEARAFTVAAAEQAVTEQQRRLEQRRTHLLLELQGLDVRARNQRQKLFEQEQRLARLGPLLEGTGERLPESCDSAVATTALVPTAIPIRPIDVPSVWLRVAGALADQREHLLEQWQNFLQVDDSWQLGHRAALVAVEDTVRSLAQREQHIITQEQALAARSQAVAQAVEEVERRHEALSDVRCALEGWEARLTVREARWQAERDAQEVTIRAREEDAAAAVARIEELQERQDARRREEIDLAQHQRQRFEELRQIYAGLWQECQERRADLATEKRHLATQAVALEHLRLELLGRSPDPATTSRRLKRLKKQHAAEVRAEEKALTGEHRRIEAETQRLEERARQLRSEQDALAARAEELTRQVMVWEEQRQMTAATEEQRRRELELLRQLREQDERQIGELRDEVERIARLLIDEGENLLPVNQAA